jgi:hypothetical protein
MSEEESDEDSSGHIIRVMRPSWRSNKLSQFLHGLDGGIRTPHSGLVSEEVEGKTKVVLGLPPSCYSD